SRKDLAGTNIYRRLAKSFGFEKTGEFEGSVVYKKEEVLLIATEKGQVEAEHLDEHFSPEYYVFASRHRSVSSERTLTVHAPGNLTEEAKVGGKPRELASAAPDAMKAALLELERERTERNLDYKVSMEVTHHGPTTLKRPVLFVEVGSTEKEWNDPKAANAVAKAALAAAENKKVYEKGIGIGGNHYAPRHTRFVLESEATLGHLVPSYALDSFDLDMLSQAVDKSSAAFCFLDWKGMKKEQREKVLKLAQKLGIPVRRTISKGEGEIPEGYTLFKVNKDLFILAEKIDPGRLRETIIKNRGIPVERDGHLLPEFTAPVDVRGEVVRTCINILRSKNPSLSGRTLVFEEKKFDPKRAEALGLKPGPDFALLKKGMEVKAGRRVITPEDVLVTKKTKIPLDDETLALLKSLNNS
ncbi:MAG: D-aminoacyl-tRNA deacylase, partial [Candidatus Hydrothermarchaeales archaeon]